MKDNILIAYMYIHVKLRKTNPAIKDQRSQHCKNRHFHVFFILLSYLEIKILKHNNKLLLKLFFSLKKNPEKLLFYLTG